MSISFNADEIFEIAEQIERNGAAFYRRAAELFSAPTVREKLLGLAAMEEQHEKTFTEMRAEFFSGEPVKMIFDPDDQAALYLQAVADGKIFDIKAEPSKALPEGISIEEVLKIAIGVEKDSVVFYTSMKELVKENLGKSRIDAIIKEEIGHISDLRAQMDDLKN